MRFEIALFISVNFGRDFITGTFVLCLVTSKWAVFCLSEIRDKKRIGNAYYLYLYLYLYLSITVLNI